MKFKSGFAIALISLSSVVFAAKETPNIQLGPMVAPAGGKIPVQLSLQPIQNYARSRWNIDCSIPNPADYNVIMQFGITMVKYSAWPSVNLNGRSLGIMGDPQGSLNPGKNTYVLSGVDNLGFSTLNFVNFDTTQDVAITCFATPATSSL